MVGRRYRGVVRSGCNDVSNPFDNKQTAKTEERKRRTLHLS